MTTPRLRLLTIALAATAAIAPVPASALVVETYTPWAEGASNPNSNLVNTSAPADDPGWANLASNRTGVYLGDHWFITAVHASGPFKILIGGGEFFPIPGTDVQIKNSNGTDSDLRIYRVGVDTTTGLTPEELDPSIRQITIADRLASTGTDLTIFGRGLTRRLNPTPQVDESTGDRIGQHYFYNANGSIIEEEVAGGYTGYRTIDSGDSWQWGKNRRYGGTSSIELGGGATKTDVFRTRFDENGGEFEAQAAAGDSGGPVFWKDDGEWVLAGLMHAIQHPVNETSNNLLSAFGAFTWISNLADADYYDVIEDLRAAPQYSVIGDLDLDGDVTGEIVNGVATGDLAILVENWMVESGDADIHSWMAGDLNQDGTTDLADFVLMREALGGSISSTAFAQLVSVQAVPEPAAAVLAAAGLLALAGRRRR